MGMQLQLGEGEEDSKRVGKNGEFGTVVGKTRKMDGMMQRGSGHLVCLGDKMERG